MAEDSQLVQASQPFSFQDFLERMKDPAAADLVRYIKTFIKSVEDRPGNPDADAQAFQDFMTRMEEVFEKHPVWATAGPDVKSQAVEALEKYVMTKLYNRTFGQSPLDKERDEVMTQRMQALSFLEPGHLDIPPAYCNENSWVLAQRELLRINSFKAPRDKLVCILNCCRIINNLLHTGAAGGDGVGADDFLPILIFVMIRANPPKLASNLEYIQRYRMQSRMMAEAAYFYTQMYSAASFVETINANSLTIDPDVFVAHMVAANVPDIGAMAPTANPTSPRRPVSVPHVPAAPASTAAAASSSAPTPAPVNGSGAAPDMSVGMSEPPVVAVESQYSAAQGPGSEALTSPAPAASAAPVPTAFPSVSDLEQEGVQQLLPLEATGELRDKHRFLYATTADLTLGDIQTLLGEYKKLVLHYEALRSAVHARHLLSRAAAASAAQQAQDSAQDSTAVLPALRASGPSAGSAGAGPSSKGPSQTDSQTDGDDSTGNSMLKLLNPFTRVPRALKGTFSLLDGPAALVSSAASTAATAWGGGGVGSVSAPQPTATVNMMGVGDQNARQRTGTPMLTAQAATAMSVAHDSAVPAVAQDGREQDSNASADAPSVAVINGSDASKASQPAVRGADSVASHDDAPLDDAARVASEAAHRSAARDLNGFARDTGQSDDIKVDNAASSAGGEAQADVIVHAQSSSAASMAEKQADAGVERPNDAVSIPGRPSATAATVVRVTDAKAGRGNSTDLGVAAAYDGKRQNAVGETGLPHASKQDAHVVDALGRPAHNAPQEHGRQLASSGKDVGGDVLGWPADVAAAGGEMDCSTELMGEIPAASTTAPVANSAVSELRDVDDVKHPVVGTQHGVEDERAGDGVPRGEVDDQLGVTDGRDTLQITGTTEGQA